MSKSTIKNKLIETKVYVERKLIHTTNTRT